MKKKDPTICFFIEDLIGFLQQFINQAAPHLASREELQGAVQNGRLLKAETGVGQGSPTICS